MTKTSRRSSGCAQPIEGAASPQAFTLVELVVAVVVVGVLAAIAFPRFFDMSESAKVASITADYRVLKKGYLEYYQVHRAWPGDNDGSPNKPFYAQPLFTENPWEKATPIGGKWNWNTGTAGNTAARPSDICIYNVGTPSARVISIMTKVDAKLDDGNLTTGFFVWEPNLFFGTYRWYISAPY
jgi:prepilin-type N-terminal cleavage/methylation domain-containing protein